MIARPLICAWVVLMAALPAAQAQGAPRAATAPIERGVGLYDGRSVAFEVVDGWAVVEGDIIIGRADALSRALHEPAGDLRPKALAVGYETNLWPRAASGIVEIPYTIAADANGRVPPAIAAFNATFAGFMQFVARTTQADYVEFALDLPASAPACSSSLGRVGGKK